jgi:hypothetical protein
VCHKAFPTADRFKKKKIPTADSIGGSGGDEDTDDEDDALLKRQ